MRKDDQDAATTLVLYPKLNFKGYNRRLTDSTVVRTKEAMTYKLKSKRVVRLVLL